LNLTEGVKYNSSFAPDGTMLLIPETFNPNVPPEQQIRTVGKYAKPVAARSPNDKYEKVSSGLGIEFQKNGEPVTLSEFMQATGRSLSSALAGSKDPGDLELLDLINIGVNANNAEAKKAAQEAEAAIRQGVDKLAVIDALKKTFDQLTK